MVLWGCDSLYLSRSRRIQFKVYKGMNEDDEYAAPGHSPPVEHPRNRDRLNGPDGARADLYHNRPTGPEPYDDLRWVAESLLEMAERGRSSREIRNNLIVKKKVYRITHEDSVILFRFLLEMVNDGKCSGDQYKTVKDATDAVFGAETSGGALESSLCLLNKALERLKSQLVEGNCGEE